jgi:hypothetical protein
MLLKCLRGTVQFNSIKINNLEAKHKDKNSKKLINNYNFSVFFLLDEA